MAGETKEDLETKTTLDTKVDGDKGGAPDEKKADGAPPESTPGEKTADGKAEAKAPEKYNFKVPEGSLLTADHVEKISLFAKEKGLSQEVAQSLLERESGAMSTYAQSQKAAFEQEKATWTSKVQSDPEIGGQKFGESVDFAKKALKAFGSESLIKTLNDTGLGNHPELVRVFSRIGRGMSDDTIHRGGSPTQSKKSMEDLFYSKP